MFVLFAVSAIILLTGSRCEYGMKMMTSSLVWSRDWNASRMISWGRQSSKSVLWVEKWMCGTTLVSRALELKTRCVLVWESLRALGRIWTACKKGKKADLISRGVCWYCEQLQGFDPRSVTCQKGDGISLLGPEKCNGEMLRAMLDSTCAGDTFLSRALFCANTSVLPGCKCTAVDWAVVETFPKVTKIECCRKCWWVLNWQA